jgi:hypothetical protein
MSQLKVKKLLQKWMIRFAIFDVIVLLYIYISGTIFGQLYGTEILLYLSYFLMLFGIIITLFGIVFAIHKKEYKLILNSLGVLLSCAVLFAIIVILAISSIY